MYLFNLPTTGAFTFGSVVSSADPLRSSYISQASAQRGRLREILKRSKRTDEKDLIGVINIVEEYLPYLFNIEAAVDQGSMTMQKGMITSWRCTLLHSPLKKEPRVEQASLQFEILFVLLTYCYALSLYASSIVDDAARLAQAADLLVRSSGIFLYLHDEILQTMPKTTDPLPETSPEVLLSLHKILLADAQMLAVDRNANASPSLLVRICVGASEHYASAKGILAGASKTLDTDVRKYVDGQQGLALGRALQYMGIEAEKKGQVGEALGCVRAAKEKFDKLSKAPDVEELDRTWTKTNDKLSFQKVWTNAEVLKKLPSGRDMLAVKIYTRPQPVSYDKETKVDDNTTAAGRYAGSGAYY